MSHYVPDVLWAQREPNVFLTIDLPAVDKDHCTIRLEPEGRLVFTGVGGTDRREFELNLELFKELNVEESKWEVLDRHVRMDLIKKDPEWWPRLLKEKKRTHYIKVDWNKWKEEDDDDVDELGLSGGGMDFGGMGGGMGGGMPDLSALAGMGGAGGMPDLSALGDLSNLPGGESPDDEIPGLDDVEEEEPKTEAPAEAPASE
eukprot:gnl/Trimastix_PCT/382.p1 GENE.gnl/Trimastix_PCT/382~~gnl/Trimastix_PCT/382.p1  ORF type:complete len:217 (+),score=45.40 gnl/Trimastix_PCT/382:48-653(+)